MTKRIFFFIVLMSMFLYPGYAVKSASAATSGDDAATLTLISSGSQGVVFELSTPVYALQPGYDEQQPYQLLSVPGLDQSTGVGKPQLPLKGVLIGVPVDADFTLNILEDEKEILPGEFNIQPVATQGPMVDEFQPGDILFTPDETIYQSVHPYPENLANMGDPAWIREQRVLQVAVYPFQYIPTEKKLVWHKRIRIEIRFVYPGQDNKTNLSSVTSNGANSVVSPFEATFQSQLINYETAKAWRSTDASVLLQGSTVEATDSGFDQLQSLGPRYKIVVDHDGVYRLTRDALNAAHDISGIDPHVLEMNNQGRKVAIYIDGDNGDSTFDSDEAIVFYGQKFYGDYLAQKYSSEDDLWLHFSEQLSNGAYTTWTPKMNATMMEKYTDDNVYWLTTGSDTSWMPTADGTPQGSTVPETYNTTVHAEQSHHWFTWNFSSEDTWFWDKIQDTYTRTYTTTLSAIATTPFTATLNGEVAARVKSSSYNPDHHNKIWINSKTTPIVDTKWDGISRYHFSASIPSTDLVEGDNELKYKVLFDAYFNQRTDWIYFDWFDITYSRTFEAENDLLQFERNEAGSNWLYEINNVTSSDVVVLDVTDPLTPTQILSSTLAGNVASFEGMDHSGNASYIVAGESALQSPKSLSYYTPPTPDLYDTGNQVDYLFVTHSAFQTGAQTLANYRAGLGMTTRVIDIDDLVNEFNYGIYNPIAIKNFLRYTFAHWTSPLPSYVVLIGDGHWNFKNYTGEYGTQTIYMPPYLAWVDPEQGEVDATNDLATIVGTDALPDLNIARMPVTTETELNHIIQKIVAYEASPVQEWQRRFLFIADNTPDSAGDFTQISEEMITDYITPVYTADHIFLDDYDSICHTSGDHSCIEATNALVNDLNTHGALVANYVGHGWNTFWASETMFSKDDVSNLNNGSKLPILLSLTCRDGYWYHPGTDTNTYMYETSLAEALLQANNKGTIGSFSPTGLGDVIGHDALQRGFYDALFLKDVHDLGEATQNAKVRLNASDPNADQIHTFVVIGDPALQFQFPFVEPGSGSQVVRLGEYGIFEFNLAHNEAITDTYTISVNGADWQTDVPATLGPLPPAVYPLITYTMPVTVTVPKGVTVGTQDVITLTITSQNDPSKQAIVTLTTIASAHMIYLPMIIR